MTHRKSLYFICGDVKKMEQGTREQGDGSVPAMVRCLLCKHEGLNSERHRPHKKPSSADCTCNPSPGVPRLAAQPVYLNPYAPGSGRDVV